MKREAKPQKTFNFWLEPIVIGAFLALGYGITERIMRANTVWEGASIEVFQKPKLFPGISLKKIQAKDNQIDLLPSVNEKQSSDYNLLLKLENSYNENDQGIQPSKEMVRILSSSSERLNDGIYKYLLETLPEY